MTQHVLAGMVVSLVLGAGVCAAEPPRAEHPRPDMMRGAWITLNGEWEFAETDDDKAEFERMRLTQPARYRVAGLGEWGVDGAVYFEEFDPDVHVIQPFSIPDYWRIERAIDYGLDALACLYVAIDTEGNAYVISEVYKHGLIVSDAAAAIQHGEPRSQTRWVTYAPPD